MRTARGRWVIAAVAVLVSSLVCWSSLPLSESLAQDAKPAAGAKASEDAQPAAAPKPPRGRLPNFYSAVVSPLQREKIYNIQSQYAGEIEALELQIAELANKRDAAIDAILSPEQRQKVQQLVEEARQRRAQRAAERAAEAAKAKPPATTAP